MKQLHKRILGIDYGEKKTGIAFADGPLASPMEVIYHDDATWFLKLIVKVIQKYEPDTIVIGMPSGTQGEEVMEVINELRKITQIPVEVIDEGFSTKEAQMLSRESGMNRKKRRTMEDAFSANIILQKYLDSMV